MVHVEYFFNIYFWSMCIKMGLARFTFHWPWPSCIFAVKDIDAIDCQVGGINIEDKSTNENLARENLTVDIVFMPHGF